jgi:transcription-repair coupling factor (superfamily II helicase)
LKGGDLAGPADQWSPQISLGLAVLIPESYVADLPLRLGLYRRLSNLTSRAEIDDFGVELVDRFGPRPDEVDALLDVMEVKGLCRQAGIQQIDAGPKGCILSFRGNRFANPSGLVAFMQKSGGAVKLQTDHKLVLKAADWDMPEARLHGVRDLVKRLVALVPVAQKAA